MRSSAMSEQPLTNEHILEMFREASRLMKEQKAEYDREKKEREEEIRLEKKERDEEFRREMKERDEKFAREKQEADEKFAREKKEADLRFQKTEQLVARVSKENARLGNRLGELVEAMVEGGILRMFEEIGYEFDVCNPRYYFGNKALDIYGEVDLFLENGDIALLVEVKTNLTEDDVREHRDRLEKFRLVADVKNDKRQFIAAVGGGVVKKNVRDFALKQGMYVIEQSGENVEISVPEGKPRVW